MWENILQTAYSTFLLGVLPFVHVVSWAVLWVWLLIVLGVFVVVLWVSWQSYEYLLFYVCIVVVLVVLYVYCCRTCCSMCVIVVVLVLCVYCCRTCCSVCVYCCCTSYTMCILLYLLNCVCIAGVTSDAKLLARSQYSEGPATDHLDTGSSWFPCV